MRTYVAICQECGAMSYLTTDQGDAVIRGHDTDAGPWPVVSRCGIMYEEDSGIEPCRGTVFLRGVVTLGDIP